MKTQKHNEGELSELSVKIESKVVESVECMAKNSRLTKEEIVVIALKRFITSHSDYMGDCVSTSSSD